MRSPLCMHDRRHFVLVCLVVWICFVVLTAVPCAAQADDNHLAYGEVRTGHLGGDIFQEAWIFSGRLGDVVTIRATRTSGDVTLILGLFIGEELSRERFLDFDYPAVGATQSTISSCQLPTTGTYIIVVSRKFGRRDITAGDYRLELVLESASDSDQYQIPDEDWAAAEAVLRDEFAPVAIERIETRYNHQATGHLEGTGLLGGGSVFYLFVGVTGDTITITMLADSDGAVDPYLNLYYYDPVQKEVDLIAYNDEAGGVHNAEITAFTLPQTGIYVIETLSVWGDGDYTVTLAETGVNEAENLMIEYGQTVAGSLTADVDIAAWTFYGSAGDEVYIIVERQTGNLISDVSLIWEKDYQVIYWDDDLDQDGIVDMTVTLDRDGYHTVLVQSRLDPNVDIEDAEFTTGSFALTVERTN